MASRTFGSPAEGGGVGVRMLVPLADMIDHGGDTAPGRLCDGSSQAADNLRYSRLPSALCDAMQHGARVSATRTSTRRDSRNRGGSHPHLTVCHPQMGARAAGFSIGWLGHGV